MADRIPDLTIERAVMVHGYNAPHEVDARTHEMWR